MHPPGLRALHYAAKVKRQTTTEPIRSLFADYVWFTVVYQGKCLVGREGAARFIPFPPGTYDR